MNAEREDSMPSVKERLFEELRKYAIVSLYLWICFAALLAYESAMLAEHGTRYLPYGVALVKALVIGKFLLIGEAIKVGDRAHGPTLLHRIVGKTIAFVLLLIVFTILEEIIVGWFHGQGISHTFSEFMERSWVEKLAPVLMMTLILIPLISTMEFIKALGRDRFRAMLLGRE